MKCLVLFLALFVFGLLSVASPSCAIAVGYDMTVSSNYTIRFDGALAGDQVSWHRTSVGDINGNGIDDFIINSFGSDNNGSYSGSIYIIYDYKINNWINSGTTTVDLADSSNWNLRIDGAGAGHYLGNEFRLADITNDGKLDLLANSGTSTYIISQETFSAYGETVGNSFNLTDASKWTYRIYPTSSAPRGFYDGDYNGDEKIDLIVHDTTATFNGANSGSVYIINNDLISLSSTGHELNLTIPSNFSVRIDGPNDNDGATFGDRPMLADFNGNGKDDVLFVNSYYDANGRSNSGSAYIIYDDKIPQTGIGHTFNLTDTSNYNVRLDGKTSGSLLGIRLNVGDGNNDDKYEAYIGSINNENYVINYSFLQNYANYSGINLDANDATSYTVKISGGSEVEAIADFNNDGANEIMAIYGYGVNFLWGKHIVDFINTGNTISLADEDNYWIRFSGNYLFRGKGWQAGDINGDGMLDFIGGEDQADYNGRSNSGSMWIRLNFPHTITASGVGGSTNSESSVVTGTVSSPLSVSNIAGVQWSLGNNPASGWHECVATDGSFDSTDEAYSCTVNMVDEGSKNIYTRAYDENRSYTAVSHYASLSTRADRTGPAKSFVVIGKDGKEYQREFKQQSLLNQEVVGYNHQPQFCFSVAGDTGSGLKEYSVKVDNNDYIASILPAPPPAGDEGNTTLESSGATIKESTDKWIRWVGFTKDEDVDRICTYGKGDAKYLNTGLHTWQVVARDEAGNSTTIGKQRFLVGTHSGSVGKSEGKYYPLSILQIGNRLGLTYSTENPQLFTDLTKALSVTDTTPTIYGLASVGSHITLIIDQESTNSLGVKERTQVVYKNTDTNINSEWGINLTEALSTGTYYLTVEAADDYNNYAVVKDVLIKI